MMRDMSPLPVQAPELAARDRIAVAVARAQHRRRPRTMVVLPPAPLRREVLVLRRCERVTDGGAAAALGLDKSAASERYARALTRLKETLSNLPRASGELSRSESRLSRLNEILAESPGATADGAA
jgi:DNA-directed RNA polymerase specialized sigma24 family protein